MNLKPGSHIHLMGICGTAMASLAGILKDMGFKVTGSDENVYPPMSTQLEQLGIKIKLGYKPDNLLPRPDLVIVGNVITQKNPEAQALIQAEVPFRSLPEMMGDVVIGKRDSYVVAGTHGKTTTTSLLAWMADQCGLKPGFLIGGIPKNFTHSFRKPEGNTFVIEGDEYDTAFFAKVPKFIFYKPKYVILTSIEFDHADIYNNMTDIMAAFDQIFDRIPKEGLMIANGDDKNIHELMQDCHLFADATYGKQNGIYKLGKSETSKGLTTFEVLYKDKVIEKIQTPLFGDYNLLNALACYAMARERGWDMKAALEAMRTFKGVKRRQEVLGEPRGITVIEDFAHHPTAVKVTVAGVQGKYPGQKVFSVFEPRSASSRRKIFENDYIDAFATSHEVILSEPYNQTTIAENERLSSDRIIDALKNRDVRAQKFNDVDAIVDYLGTHARAGDVILVMSNGAFGGIYQKLLTRLEAG